MNSHRIANFRKGSIFLKYLAVSVLISLTFAAGTAQALMNPFYSHKSYAIVIGINQYASNKFPYLPYSVADAKAFGKYLEGENFSVKYLITPEDTTRTRIKTEIQKLARNLVNDDRVVIYFSGHGYSESLGDEEFGYIVPSDGTDSSATYISMEELRTLSRMLGIAKHQLFILDACFGGLIGMKDSTTTFDKPYPNYLSDVTNKPARQFLTAGGSEQRVRAAGPGQHSYFTSYLLEGLRDGKADIYPDGYISILELGSYLQARASNVDQTPRYGVFEKHGMGDFVFVSPKGSQIASVEEVDTRDGRPAFKGGSETGYGSIRIVTDVSGKVFIDKKEKRWIDTGEEQEYLKQAEGEHEVSLVSFDNSNIVKKVVVRDGQVTPVRIASKKRDGNTPVGKIRVYNMEPVEKCKLYIDNEYIAELAPKEEKDYTAEIGRHQVEIQFSEYILSKTLMVKENKISELRARLKPPSNLRIMSISP